MWTYLRSTVNFSDVSPRILNHVYLSLFTIEWCHLDAEVMSFQLDGCTLSNTNLGERAAFQVVSGVEFVNIVQGTVATASSCTFRGNLMDHQCD